MMKLLAKGLLLMAVAGCAIVPASRGDLPQTTVFTINEEGKVVEIPTAFDRAWKWEIVPRKQK